MNDSLSLVGRVLIGLVFLLTVILGSPNAGYVGSVGFSSPDFWSVVARAAEWLIVISLVLGVWTRWGAILGILYVIIATAVAHRFWQSPDAQWVAQYTNFSKNLAILGGLILVYITGAGAFSLDAHWTRRRTT
jgi:putative oxidoreductase